MVIKSAHNSNHIKNNSDSSKRMEKWLNVVVAISTCIVLLLVFEEMDHMMAAIEMDEPVTVVSVLSEKCTDVWQSHRQNIISSGSNSLSSGLEKQRRYSLPGDGFCSRLPADISAAHLWNEHLPWILQASSNEEDITSHLLTTKLLQFLSPIRLLELGIRSRPADHAWVPCWTKFMLA
jgi:hypothetical protein